MNIKTKTINKEVLSLYVHIPFCEHICSYCDFAKFLYSSLLCEKYLSALEKEIESYDIKSPLKTIYVGGGTPTSLNILELERLLKILSKYSYAVEEYTFEANPENLDEEKLLLLYSYGVNRLSLGVQSTNDKILKMLNRHHNFSQVKTVIQKAKEIGFKNINVDLILGLPFSKKESIISDLENIISLDVNHISTYSLTISPHTIFYLKGIKEMDSDTYRYFYDIVHKYLLSNGYIHYEISNFSKKGYESKHNLTYWFDEYYYGVGLGSSGYINNYRYTNTKSLNKYLEGQYTESKEEINLENDLEYYLMLSLRTSFGVDIILLKEYYHYDILLCKKDIIKDYERQNLLFIKDYHLILTYPGMMILDHIYLDLIP